MPLRAATFVALLAVLAPLAHADPDYFGHAASSTKVVMRHPRSRTTSQRLLIWGVLGGAALSAGVGIAYNVDSHDAASAVSTTHDKIVGTWTAAEQATYDRAGSSGTLAIVGYAVAGGLVASALTIAYLTRPGYETTAIAPTASIVSGGAVVGLAGHL